MKILTLLVFIPFAPHCVADEEKNPATSESYTRFKGEWRLVEIQNPGPHCLLRPPDSRAERSMPEVFVTVTGNQFEMSGAGVKKEWLRPLDFYVPAAKTDNPYRKLKEYGTENVDDIIDIENQICVFWFVGIYKLTDDKLQLALKYYGQGVEGVEARTFRPPSSFDDKIMKDEVRLVLKRSE